MFSQSLCTSLAISLCVVVYESHSESRRLSTAMAASAFVSAQSKAPAGGAHALAEELGYENWLKITSDWSQILHN